MFGKKNAQLLEEAEARLLQQQERLDWYKRHYEKQQGYIEELYDAVADLSRQLGMVLQSDNLERLQNHPNRNDNSNFFYDLYLLFSARLKKGQNVSCYFGKDLDVIQRKFQDRDFKNGRIIRLTERMPLNALCSLIKDGLWRRPLEDSLKTIRSERKLD